MNSGRKGLSGQQRRPGLAGQGGKDETVAWDSKTSICFQKLKELRV
jgi:hypothetical protein